MIEDILKEILTELIRIRVEIRDLNSKKDYTEPQWQWWTPHWYYGTSTTTNNALKGTTVSWRDGRTEHE